MSNWEEKGLAENSYQIEKGWQRYCRHLQLKYEPLEAQHTNYCETRHSCAVQLLRNMYFLLDLYDL